MDDEFMSKMFEDEKGVRSMNTAWEKMRKEAMEYREKRQSRREDVTEH